MKLDGYQKALMLTIVATILLICVGTLVRVTGAGLGCPDWPKCWGKWLPPSSVEEIDFTKLPPEKFAHATKADFNHTKMWIEYGNRLFGVFVGMLVVLCTFLAFRNRSETPRLFRWAWITLVVVIAQGLLGAVVVRTGLKQGTVTLHLALAFGMLLVLIYTFWISVSVDRPRKRFEPRWMIWTLLGLTMVQMLLGAEVRASIEEIGGKTSGATGYDIIAQVGWLDHIHRAFSWSVLLMAGFLHFRVRKEGPGLPLVYSRLILIFVVAQIVFGVVLAYGGLPAPFKILHLSAATLMISVEFLFLVETGRQVVSLRLRSNVTATAGSHSSN